MVCHDGVPSLLASKKERKFLTFTGNVKLESSSSQTSSSEGIILFGQQSFQKILCACWLCVSLSNKAQFWNLGSIDNQNDKLYLPIYSMLHSEKFVNLFYIQHLVAPNGLRGKRRLMRKNRAGVKRAIHFCLH